MHEIYKYEIYCSMSEADTSLTKTPLFNREYTDEVFLRLLGERVRQIRAQRGMSRRLLSESADVSERYLAQLEAGKGNVSILLLRQIAAAMGVRVDNLVDLSPDLPPTYDALRERIRHMSEPELERLYKDVSSDHQTNSKKNRVALLGLRGAGKSTVGARLAKVAKQPFQELAATIEEVAGMKLDEIFSLGGQASYRMFEQQAISELLTDFRHGVLAVGGSVVADTSTFEQVLGSFTTIWLKASPEEHMARVVSQGDKRPMAGNKRAMDELRRILIEREPLYRKADFVVDTQDKSVAQVCEEIMSLNVFANIK